MPLCPDVAAPVRTWPRAALLLGAVLPLGVLLGFAGPAAADAGPTVGIAAAPAKQGQPDGRSRFSLLVQPGQKVGDELLVLNAGSTDQRLHVYATDAFDTADGAFALLDGSATPAGAGTWVRFDAGARDTVLTLAAGAQALVPFTVTVPATATPGDHAAGVVVSVASSAGQVTVDRRLATRLYVRVRGTVQPSLTVRSVTAAQPVGGDPFSAPTTITAVVANTGDVALTARATANLRTWFGRPVGTAGSRDVAELLPGATRTLTFDVGRVARAGYLEPQLTLVPVADADAYGFALPPVVGRGTSVAVPWLLLGVALAASAGLGVVVLRRRRAAVLEATPGSAGVAEPQEAARETAAVKPTPTPQTAAGGRS